MLFSRFFSGLNVVPFLSDFIPEKIIGRTEAKPLGFFIPEAKISLFSIVLCLPLLPIAVLRL